MGREKPGYRDTIALLNARFPEKDALDVKDVMAFLGRSRNTVKRHVRFNPMGVVTKPDLARQVCIGGAE